MEDWGCISPFQKGDQDGDRGITLLSLPGKVYSQVQKKKGWKMVETWIHEEQCGFVPGLEHRGHGSLHNHSPYVLGTWEPGREISWGSYTCVHRKSPETKQGHESVRENLLREDGWYQSEKSTLGELRSLGQR